MSKKILNLYAGIGGNRKLWDEVVDIEVTAVEIDEKIAKIYQDHFPEDEVIIADAHEYLKKHYDEDWDFVWSSPPCPTHSRVRHTFGSSQPDVDVEPVYFDMRLYQEIVFLEHYFDGNWIVENVVPYYGTLIKPSFKSDKHWLWSNFSIPSVDVPTTGVIEVDDRATVQKDLSELEKHFGFDISDYEGINKEKILRNCVHPKLGKHVLECALGNKQMTLDKIGVEA